MAHTVVIHSIWWWFHQGLTWGFSLIGSNKVSLVFEFFTSDHSNAQLPSSLPSFLPDRRAAWSLSALLLSQVFSVWRFNGSATKQLRKSNSFQQQKMSDAVLGTASIFFGTRLWIGADILLCCVVLFKQRPCVYSKHLRTCLRLYSDHMWPSALVCISVLIMDVPGPFDHGLRGAIEEDEFGVKLLLQLQLCSLTHLQHRKKRSNDQKKQRNKATDELAYYIKERMTLMYCRSLFKIRCKI